MKTIGNSNRIQPAYTVGNAPTNNVAYTDLANAFTLAQSISLATAGTALTLSSTESGASEGPAIDLYRDSATPAALDSIGQINFLGKDDGGNSTIYAKIGTSITDVADGTEDANLAIGAMRSGTLNYWVFGSGALYHQSLTKPSTAGAINATQIQVNNAIVSSGMVIRHGRTNYTTYTTLTSVIPNDDSIPQIGEGTEIATLSVTPLNASSVLRIRAGLAWTSGGVTVGAVMAIFVDATANAIAARTAMSEASTTVVNSNMYEWEIAAGSISARTYRLRVGPGTAGNLYVNGDSSSRQLGGLTQSFIAVEECLP